MNEREFWLMLEYRLCHEFAGMPQNNLRFRWCDGFLPDDFHLNGPFPQISGRVWIVDGQDQENWGFTLILDRPVNSRSEIDWLSLAPLDNVTKWMAVDLFHKRIEIEPSAAVPDLK